MTKICKKCKEEKELSKYYKNKEGKNGYLARCKECVRAAEKVISLRKKVIPKEKICGHCKVKKSIDKFHKLASRIDGYHPNCKECKNKHRYSPVSKYTVYKNDAARRGFEFEISFEEFKLYWKKKCEYCNSEIETIGLDRVDNNAGYKIENIKSCCKVCNYMKREHSFDEWTEHMIKILSYNKIGV